MGFFILLLFIGIPVIEIATFIQVGDIIGLWPTLSIVILTAFIGTALLRKQGLSTLLSAQNALNEGRMPTEELFDGACLLIAGAFLLTPGFVTDSIGFLLFFPPFRHFIRDQAKRFLKNNASIHIVGGAQQTESSEKKSTVIDADFEDITPNPESPWGAKDTLPKD
jgi:UPF0716 protein FxsA